MHFFFTAREQFFKKTKLKQANATNYYESWTRNGGRECGSGFLANRDWLNLKSIFIPYLGALSIVRRYYLCTLDSVLHRENGGIWVAAGCI